MTELTSYFILAFSSLFTLVNPIGLSPVFLSMVDHCDDKERQKIALKGVLTALVVLIIFTFLGRLVFSFFSITVSGFKIAGPGAITSVMILSSEAGSWKFNLVLFIVIILILSLTFIIFQAADYLSQRFGTTGLRITQRIMGLILMVIAVQFVIDGVEPVILKWIN